MRRLNQKVPLWLTAVVLVTLGLPFFAAFEAQVVNVRAHIEKALKVSPKEIDFGVVFPQEEFYKQEPYSFTISLSQSFLAQERAKDVSYQLVQKEKLKPSGEPYLDLRPYIDKQKDPLEIDKDDDLQDKGNLDKRIGDTFDKWYLDFKVPPIAGSVPQDYEGPVAPEEGDYGLDLWIEVTGFSYGVKHVIDFDDIQRSLASIGTRYPGIRFGFSSSEGYWYTLSKADGGLNYWEYPPHSDPTVVWLFSHAPFLTPISGRITFDTPVREVDGWFGTGALSTVTLEAYDASDNLVGSISGASGYGGNVYLVVTSPISNIKYVIIHNGNDAWIMDDFSFTP